MSGRATELRAAWRALQAERSDGGVLTYPLTGTPVEVRACLTGGSIPGLLVRLADDETAHIPALLGPERGGVLVASHTWLSGGDRPEDRFLWLRCLDRQADEAFVAFCAMLCERIGSRPVGRVLQECTDEFRRLLHETARTDASDIGVLGELVVLDMLTRRDPALLGSWTGPEGARHDFRRGAVALEIKTTVRTQARGRTVRISDIDQLEPPADGELYLALVRLEPAMSGTVTIERLVSAIETRLEPSAGSRFVEVVRESSGGGRNRQATYEIKETVAYRVRDAFPRLTAERLTDGRLDTGVSRVTYDLSLDSASAFEVPLDAALDALVNARA